MNLRHLFRGITVAPLPQVKDHERRKYISAPLAERREGDRRAQDEFSQYLRKGFDARFAADLIKMGVRK